MEAEATAASKAHEADEATKLLAELSQNPPVRKCVSEECSAEEEAAADTARATAKLKGELARLAAEEAAARVAQEEAAMKAAEVEAARVAEAERIASELKPVSSASFEQLQ